MKNKIFFSVLSFTLQLFFNLVYCGQLEDNLNFEQDNTNEFQADIANEIDNYLLNVRKTFGFIRNEQIRSNKFKRNTDAGSTMMNLDDVYRLQGFNGVYKLPAHFPNDAILFCLRNITSLSSEDCYGVALESDEGSVIHSNYVVLYKFENTTESFKEVDRVFVKYGFKLSTQLINNFQYVVVAECNDYNVNNTSEGTLIYKINQERSKFELVQTLNDKYLSDVIIWEQKNMNNAIFMAVATNSTDGYQWNTESYIYKWLGTYFDKVDVIKTHSPKSITTFTIGSTMYLAVANYQNNYGETDIDSEIFRYNVDKEKFLLHQKLRTHAAVDIKYFCFKDNSGSVFPRKESFLVVANNFVADSDGARNYDTYSVIYKFTEDEYFIPFQTVNVVAPVQWLPISEGRDKFLLLVASEIFGIKAFQYNGWRFVESTIRYSKGSFGPGVVSMRRFLFNHKNVLLISNKRKEGDSDNIFTVSYERDNKLRKFYSKLETLCNDTLDDVKEHNIVISKMLKSMKDMPRVTDPLIEVNDTIIFNNDEIRIKNIVTEIHEETVEGKAFEFDYSEIDDFVNEKNLELETLKRNFEVHPSHSFQGTENISTAEFECQPYPCIFNELYIETLNGENFTSFLKNALNLRENLTIDSEKVPLEFENVAVVNPIEVDYINNHKLSDLITYDDLSNLNQKLVVLGDVIIENNNGIFVGGKVDGIHITNDSVLLKSGYQNLTDKTLVVESLNVEILNVGNTLNGIQLSDSVKNNNSDKLFKRYDKSDNIIDSVVVDELTLTDGQLSGVNFNDFFVNAMKLNAAKQVVTGSHSYDKIVADEIHVDGNVIESKISVIIDTDVPQNNYSRIDTVEIRPDYSAQYTVNTSTYNFSPKSLESGNDTITDGSVIDKNSKENGINENVNGSESLKHHEHAPSGGGSHNKEKLRKHENENVHDEDVTIREDVIIDGKLIIQGAKLNVGDLMMLHENINVTDLINDALRLDQDNIDMDFVFNTSVKSEMLKVETINGIKPETWIMKNNTNNYNITGHKIFAGNLYFNDGVILNGKINGIDVKELANGAKNFLQNVEIDESGIQSKSDLSSGSLVDSNPDIVETNDKITLTGTVIVKNNINVQSLTTHNDMFVNGVHLKELLSKIANDSYDTMEFGSPQVFSKNLIIDHLYCDHLEEFNITEIRNMHYCHIYDLDSDDNFLNYFHNKSVVVENLKFTGNLDGVTAEEFGKWLLRKGDQEIVGLQTFNLVEAKNGVNVTSSVVNNVNIKDLAEDGVKIDQLVELSGITFDGLVTSRNVEVKGLINNINITDDAVLKNMSSSPESPVVITGHKVLINDLVANEINMPSVNKLCELFSGVNNQLLSVNGSLRFSKEPIVEVLNNFNMTALSDFAWFIYEDKTINSSVTFTNVTFLNDVDLKGTLNDVNVKQFNKQYFSLTKSQTVLTPIKFSGGIETKGQIRAAKLRVGRFVNGINLEHFYNIVLVDGKDQIIQKELDFENVTFEEDFRTTGLINGLDLASDVLILNEEDLNQISNKTIFVKGLTKIENVVTEELIIPNKSVEVQHVNINEWFRLAVKKSGTYVINGNKTFSNGINIIGNISVNGSVNGLRFDEDNLLLTRGDQILTGFNLFDELSSVTVRNLNTYNLISDHNITDLIERQVYIDEDAVVTGNKTFLSNITAIHITLPEFYGSLNLSKLNNELTNYRKFKAYFFENELESLKNIKKNVEMSIFGQAYILKEFELKQRFKGNVHAVIPLKPQGHSPDQDLIGVITWAKQSNVGGLISRTQGCHLTIHKWNSEAYKFLPLPGFRNHLSSMPTLISPISTHENENNLKYGKFFMVFSSSEKAQHIVSQMNKTSSTDSVSDASFDGWIFDWDTTLSKPLRFVQPIAMKYFGSLIHVYDSCYLLQEQNRAPQQCHLYCGNNLTQTLNCTNNVQSIVTSDGNTTFVIFPKKIHGQHDHLNSTADTTKMDIMKFNSDARKLESIKSIITHNITFSLSAIYDSDKQEHVMAVSAGSLTVFRFNHNWDMISNFTSYLCNDTTTDKHIKTSIKMKILPTNELVIFIASPCCKPKSLIWVGGLSDPKIIPINIPGNEIKEVIPFDVNNRNKNTKERLYIVVTDITTAVFKPIFTTV